MNNLILAFAAAFGISCVFYIKYIRVLEEKNKEITEIKRKLEESAPTKKEILENSFSRMNRHPVLEYKMAQDSIIGGSTPASIGDIIAPPDVAGPYYDRNSFAYNSKMIRPSEPVPGTYGYGYNRPGRYGSFGEDRRLPGPSVTDERGMGVSVPAGALKFSNERYNRDQFIMNRNENPWSGARINFPGIPDQRQNASADFYKPYGPNSYINTTPFFGSVNSYSPFPEIISPWEKAGVLTSISKHRGSEEILNLFRRAIAPLQDLWEYQIQDKDGFVIKLYQHYIEDGDIIDDIIGKHGPWKAHIFVQDKYIRV